MDLLKIKALILLQKVIHSRTILFVPSHSICKIEQRKTNYSVKTSNIDIRVAFLYKYNTVVELLTKPITNYWQCFAIEKSAIFKLLKLDYYM